MKNIILFFLFSFFIGCGSQKNQVVDLINNEILRSPSAAGIGMEGRENTGDSMTYYIDPVNGSMSNPGTSEFPWRTLEEVIKQNLIETRDQYGTIINPGALVKAGDTLVLRSGFHGHVQIKNAFNDYKIIVKAEQGSEPKLAELELLGVRNWIFSGLSISPKFSDKPIRTNYIVSIGDSGYFGKTSNVVIQDSYIRSFLKAPEKLTINEWNSAKTGVLMGRSANNLVVKNNFIQSVAFGISAAAPGSVIEGNVVTDFSMDGLRLISSNTIVKLNVIKNNYNVGNGNHDDGIQGFSYNGTDLYNSSLIGNIILNRDKKGIPFPGEMQGIGFFDGPFYDFLVQNNVVMSFSWHGVSIYDSVGGKIQSNIVYTPDNITDDKNNVVKTRISLGAKNKAVTMSNLLAENISHQYLLYDNDELNEVLNLDYDDLDQSEEDVFMKNLRDLLGFINSAYGEVHSGSGKKRINVDFMLYGPTSIVYQ